MSNMRDWTEVEKRAAELWCRATWCTNHARAIRWEVANECRKRYEKGDREPTVTRGYQDYNCLSDLARGRTRGTAKGRAAWYCVEHTAELEASGHLTCIARGCSKPLGRRPARGYCGPHYQHWIKHGTTEYMSDRLPMEPALQYLASMGGLHGAGLTAKQRERWDSVLRQDGITLFLADRFAVEVLRTHPAIVWGDVWWDQSAMESA